jgi:hypothetical protein
MRLTRSKYQKSSEIPPSGVEIILPRNFLENAFYFPSVCSRDAMIIVIYCSVCKFLNAVEHYAPWVMSRTDIDESQLDCEIIFCGSS